MSVHEFRKLVYAIITTDAIALFTFLLVLLFFDNDGADDGADDGVAIANKSMSNKIWYFAVIHYLL